MPYLPIQLGPAADKSIQKLVEGRVDLYLRDVHAMLRLPLPEAEIDSGCNFALAATLCSVVAGLSRIFLVTTRGAGEAFRNVLAEYPYAEEPAGAIVGIDFAAHLYDTYRNNLAHSLGVNVAWNGAEYEIESFGTVKIARQWPSISQDRLKELEGDVRPTWLGKTLELDGRTYKLGVESLYWGVRNLTQRLASTKPYTDSARKILSSASRRHGLSVMGTPGPRYKPDHEISATATAVNSSAFPEDMNPSKRKGGDTSE